MSIEKALSDLTAALIANTEAVQALTKLQGGKPAAGKAGDKEEAKAETKKTTSTKATKSDEDEITKEVMQAALGKVKDELSTDDAKAVIADVTGKAMKMADIPEKFYAAIVKACKAKLEGGGESNDNDDGL